MLPAQVPTHMFPWHSLNISRYTVSGIVIGLVAVALLKAWLQS